MASPQRNQAQQGGGSDTPDLLGSTQTPAYGDQQRPAELDTSTPTPPASAVSPTDMPYISPRQTQQHSSHYNHHYQQQQQQRQPNAASPQLARPSYYPPNSQMPYSRQSSNSEQEQPSPKPSPPVLSAKELEHLQEQRRQQQSDGGQGSSGLPPPYSAPSRGSSAEMHQEQMAQQAGPQGPPRYTGLPKIDYRLYAPPTFELLSDVSGIKTVAPQFSKDPKMLAELMLTQASVPPKPIILIRGNRGRRVDFEVKCNLMPLLITEDPEARLDYVRCVGKGETALRGGSKSDVIPHVDGGLDAWIKLFLSDQSHSKAFVLERQVANLDIGWLEGQIRNLVSATGYKGVVTVKFPVLHGRVIVQSPDRVNKFFTTVSTLFTGKNTYEVVKAVWPFATHKNGEPQRRCVVQSEEAWWKEWCDPIKYAIASQRTGWVTNEDKLEAIMEGKGKGIAAVDWGEVDASA